MPVAPNTASSMIVRTASNPAYTIYNLGQNQILLGQDIITSGQLGSDFNFAGPGAVVWDFPQNTLDLWVSHPSTIVVGGSGGTTFSVPVTQFVVYNINGNTITGSSPLGEIGQDWEVLGLGHFSSQFGLNMIVRNIDTQLVWIYDVIQTGTGYAAQLSSAVSPGQTQPGVLGPIGLEWKVAGIAPLNANLFPANLVTDDLVMRNTNTGALQAYNIRSDTLTGSAAFTPPAANPTAAPSTVGGMAVDFSPQASGSTSQLVQAMAGIDPGSGAAGGLNAAPLGADSSQQSFLTTPQHG